MTSLIKPNQETSPDFRSTKNLHKIATFSKTFSKTLHFIKLFSIQIYLKLFLFIRLFVMFLLLWPCVTQLHILPWTSLMPEDLWSVRQSRLTTPCPIFCARQGSHTTSGILVMRWPQNRNTKSDIMRINKKGIRCNPGKPSV